MARILVETHDSSTGRTMNDIIFDERLATLRLERAARIARSDANFLSSMAMEEISDRLSVTNRSFARCLIVSHDRTLVEKLASRLTGGNASMEISLLSPLELFGSADGLLEPETIDLVVSPFGLHRINDLPGALARLRRALRPDGLLLAALPGDGSFHELRDCLISAESVQGDGVAMRVDPFVDIRQAGGLLQRAGFTLPVADAEKLVLRYSNPLALVAELRAMACNSTLISSRRRMSRNIWKQAEEHYIAKYADADGRIRASLNIVYLTGWSPHETQQKPLKPGSAQQSLKSVL